MIRLVGRDGFEGVVDPDKITAFGLETPAPTLWVRIDGREFSFSENVQEQHAMLRGELQKTNRTVVGLAP